MHLLSLLRFLLAALLLPLIAQAEPVAAVLALHGEGRQLTWIGAGAQHTATLPAPLTGPLQIAPDGRAAYAARADGQIVRLALPSLVLTAQTDAGTGSGAPLLALSGDGRFLLAAGAQEARAQIFDADLQPVRTIAIATLDGRQRSGAAQLRTHAARRSWLLAPAALNELWEISYDPQAAPIFDGLVHDYRMGEAIPTHGFLGVRRTPLPAPWAGLLVPPGTALAVGAERCTPPAPCSVRVYHLDARSQISAWPIETALRLEDAATWQQGGRPWLALASTGTPPIPVELPRGQPRADGAALPAPATRLWAQTPQGPLWLQRSDGHWLRLELRTLAATATVAAAPGSTLRVAGDALLLITPGPQGRLVWIDATTLHERRQLPLPGLITAWAVNP